MYLVNEEEELGEADGVKLAQDSEHYENHLFISMSCLIKCFVPYTSVWPILPADIDVPPHAATQVAAAAADDRNRCCSSSRRRKGNT